MRSKTSIKNDILYFVVKIKLIIIDEDYSSFFYSFFCNVREICTENTYNLYVRVERTKVIYYPAN